MKFLKVLKVLFNDDTWRALGCFIKLIGKLITTHHDTIAIIIAIIFFMAAIIKCFEAIEKSKKEIKKMTIRCPECHHEMQMEEFSEDVKSTVVNAMLN